MIFRDYLQQERIINIGFNILTIIGTIWLILEVLSYFFPSIQDNIILPNEWWILPILILIVIIIPIYINRPISQINEAIDNRDITISVVIGDFFDQEGDLIVGSNTTFDTDLEKIISIKSIQGQFTDKYFKENIGDLDEIIETELKSDENYQVIAEGDKGIGKNKKYPIGKTITVKNGDISSYFLAIADINEHGNASSSYENILDSISSLWDYISSCGDMEPLVIPILGTGRSRIETKKEKIIQEIIKSFIAACSEKRFTEKLTIVIYPDDYYKYGLNLNKLNKFLKCQCQYANFKQNSNSIVGIGIEH